jgi:PPOX class probable F420-dependent enzyme
MTDISKEKQRFINDFLAAPLIARMATADAQGRPHVVPVWFAWDDEAIWISSFTNTRKIAELEENPYISIAIDTVEEDGTNKAVVFEGKVELIREPHNLVAEKSTWIYKRYLGEAGILEKDPQSWIADPHNSLIKLVPEKTLTWQY